MSSCGSALSIALSSTVECLQCAPSNAQIQEAAYPVQCRMRSAGRLCCCVVLSQVGVALGLGVAVAQRWLSMMRLCTACMYSPVQCRQDETLQSADTRRRGRVQAPDEVTLVSRTLQLGPSPAASQPASQLATTTNFQPHRLGARVIIICPYSWLGGIAVLD